MRTLTKAISIVGILGILFSCTPSESQDLIQIHNQKMDYQFPYENSESNKIYFLPVTLKEISGIHHIGNSRIAAVQDEKGKIYVYDLNLDRIVDDYYFAKNGDYEDLEIVGDRAYLLRSDGRLVVVENWQTENSIIMKVDTEFKVKNNCEGLCFDSKENSFLIALKGKAGVGDNKIKNRKAIYKLSYETYKLDTEPYFLINDKDVENKIEALREVSSYSQFSENLIGKEYPFKPSAIAVHPLTGNYYVLSNTAFVLMVFNRSGEILSIVRLEPSIFRQAEGICFDADANLYISNEANKGQANIVMLKGNK